jgi:hypothetical protein
MSISPLLPALYAVLSEGGGMIPLSLPDSSLSFPAVAVTGGVYRGSRCLFSDGIVQGGER